MSAKKNHEPILSPRLRRRALRAKSALADLAGTASAAGAAAAQPQGGYEAMLIAQRAASLLSGRDMRNSLTFTQWEAMRFYAGIYQSYVPRTSTGRASLARPDSITSFARHMNGLHVSNATKIVTSLEKRGLLRMVSPHHEGPKLRGGYRVELTTKGHDLIARDPLREVGAAIDRLALETPAARDIFDRVQRVMISKLIELEFKLPTGPQE